MYLLAKNSKPGQDYSTHRLLIGTHTSGAEQNYLQIANVQLPVSSVELSNYDEDRGGLPPHESEIY
jgi:histone-binding protein RBBP4